MCRSRPLYTLGLVLCYVGRIHFLKSLFPSYGIFIHLLNTSSLIMKWSCKPCGIQGKRLINEAAGNILVCICWRLCTSFSSRMDYWSFIVTERIILQILHLFLPNRILPLLHPLLSGRTMWLILANEMAAERLCGTFGWKHWKADLGVSSVPSASPATIELLFRMV